MSNLSNSLFSLNYMGYIPFNPDNLPERRLLVGQGTDRPIGFSSESMHNLYWNVRSFKVGISSLSNTDPLTAFLTGGGTSGGIIGILNGLSAANLELSKGVGTLNGNTKIINRISLKNREGMKKSEKEKSNLKIIDARKEGVPRVTFSREENPNEGTICGAGPVHSLTGFLGRVEIDFSNIIYVRRLYWPVITISLGERFNESISSWTVRYNPELDRNEFKIGFGQISGGISFQGGSGTIPLFASQTGPLPPTLRVGLGTISPLKTCCGYFFHDGRDERREETVEGCENCKKKN
jgi:hypothetical protein